MLQVFTVSATCGSVRERSDHTDSPTYVFRMNTAFAPQTYDEVTPILNIYDQVNSQFSTSTTLLQMAINAAVHPPPPTITTGSVHTEASLFKGSPNREPPRPQQWQKMAVVSMKDFNLTDIRSEFDCNKAGWASVDIEVHFTSNDGLLMD